MNNFAFQLGRSIAMEKSAVFSALLSGGGKVALKGIGSKAIGTGLRASVKTGLRGASVRARRFIGPAGRNWLRRATSFRNAPKATWSLPGRIEYPLIGAEMLGLVPSWAQPALNMYGWYRYPKMTALFSALNSGAEPADGIGDAMGPDASQQQLPLMPTFVPQPRVPSPNYYRHVFGAVR